MGSAPPGEELCLRWNDFESILSRSFSEMRQESDFFDVKIACFDEKSVMKTIPAHKVVLSACSPVFKEILRGMTMEKSPLIFLRGISYHEVEAVLDFMYNGQTKVQHTELDAFLAAAEDLKVRGLTTSANNKSEPEPSTSSRKRASVASESAPSAAAESGKKAKKSKADSVVVKSEQPEKYAEEVDLADIGEDSYQDYDGADLEAYDESSYQEEGGAANDFSSSDNKVYVEPTSQERKAKLSQHVIFDPDMGREVCGFCRISYTTKNKVDALRILYNHIEAEHIKIIAYFCPYCKRGFYNPNQKSSHMATTHKGLRSKRKSLKIKPEPEIYYE